MVQQFRDRPLDFIPPSPPEAILRALAGVEELVRAGTELVRAQLTRGLPQAARLEPISTAAAKLLVEGGVVGTFDEGVLLFHDRISRDKPALRKLLRKSDVRAGRIARVRATKAQIVTRLALKAGMVTRGKDGKIKAFTPAARAAIKKAKSKDQLARKKKIIARQLTAAKKLKGIGG